MNRDNEPLATRPNGGHPSRLVVKDSGRKPLFARPVSSGDDSSRLRDKENDRPRLATSRNRLSMLPESILRRSTSEPQTKTLERRASTSSLGSPGPSRIPKPSSSMTFSNRKQLTLREAMNRAALEQSDESDRSVVMDASPSPAPRIARARQEEEDARMRKVLGRDHLDSKVPVRPFSRNSLVTSTLAEARSSPEKQDSPRRRSLYGKPRTGLGQPDLAQSSTSPKPNGTKPDDQTEASARSRLDNPSNRLQPTRWLKHIPSKDDLTSQGRIPPLVPGIEDMPWPSIENGDRQAEPDSLPTKDASPGKSFAWELDQDFTGEVQVSDSPRLRLGARPFADRIKFDENSEIDINSRTRVANPGSRNTKLDEIRTREVKAGSNIPIQSPRRQPNTKIAEIQQREAQAEHQIPIPDRTLPKPSNTKIEEIRQREINGISNRSLAKMKLDEIREQNSNSASRSLSRSLSPEESRPQSSRTAPGVLELDNKPPVRPKSAFEIGGERIADTPVTIFKSHEFKSRLPLGKDEESSQPTASIRTARPVLHGRSDSRDLLRQLARAASSSPAPDTEEPRKASPPPADELALENTNAKLVIPRRDFQPDPKPSQPENPKSSEVSKPSVAFKGLAQPHSRTRSIDSVKSKRSSMQSEADPTDRIAAEMNLFAPAETQSEKGSTRAPSPLPESEDEEPEATPRPLKQDPLSMPTPKITGAYVETPATVKVEKIELKDKQPLPKQEAAQAGETAEEVKRPRTKSWTSLRDDKSEQATKPLRTRSSSAHKSRTKDLERQSHDTDTASDPGTDEKSVTTALSAGLRRRRTQSLTRRRGTLRNSARLPTAKDDLLQLQRVHQIEDSTVDDLEEVISGRKTPSPRMKALLKSLPTDPSLEDDDDVSFDLDLDTRLNTKSNQKQEESDQSDGVLAAYTRMTKSLQTGLMGIRTAKRGIERLEDQFAHDTKPPEPTTTAEPITTEKPPTSTKSTDTKHHESDSHNGDSNVTYLRLPTFPRLRLYHRKPFRFTMLGLMLFILGLWCAAESAMCYKYCRPSSCNKGRACMWSYHDPDWGSAIPIKIDQWTTGGQGRVEWNKKKEQLNDWASDMLDEHYYHRDITQVTEDELQGYTFQQKRQHRRRLAKKGMPQDSPSPLDAEQANKWEAWRKATVAKERAEEARQMGYEVNDEDEGAIGGDERVW